MAATRLPPLPPLLGRKIYKTGQTRGADDDQIFQNRVLRNATVLIPYPIWTRYFTADEARDYFENGYIVLVSPNDYFHDGFGDAALSRVGLSLGQNALLFYESRAQWVSYDPTGRAMQPAQSRLAPLLGQYVARCPATTAGPKIVHGFASTASKGAGIRVYEYASNTVIENCRVQLEALFWLCVDSGPVALANGMTEDAMDTRCGAVLFGAEERGLLDREALHQTRSLSANGRPTCPLCLEELSAEGFFTRLEQAEGRSVLDLTVTQINMFHVEELRMGAFNHRPYNLGWGHHHCNVVAKDAGITETLAWMDEVLQRNVDGGYIRIRGS